MSEANLVKGGAPTASPAGRGNGDVPPVTKLLVGI